MDELGEHAAATRLADEVTAKQSRLLGENHPYVLQARAARLESAGETSLFWTTPEELTLRMTRGASPGAQVPHAAVDRAQMVRDFMHRQSGYGL